MRVFIHAGHLSVDNGAVAPLTVLFELAKAVDCEKNIGTGYGDDSLDIAEGEWATVEALLLDAKMLYRVEGRHESWQGVASEAVRARLQRR